MAETHLLPLPKTGDLSDTENYREISLSSIVAKMVNQMILHCAYSLRQKDNCDRINMNSDQNGQKHPTLSFFEA